MKRALLIAALVLASVASAADKKPQGKKKTSDTAEKQKAPTASPAVLRDLKNAKQAFMAAMGACVRPEQCDPASRSANREAVDLVTSTEETFMVACKACAPEEKCEAERQRIRDGKQSRGYAPCK